MIYHQQAQPKLDRYYSFRSGLYGFALNTYFIYRRESGENPAWRTSPTKMTSSEAFVETLVSHDTNLVFGIVGSAFMDALDIFDPAGIR